LRLDSALSCKHGAVAGDSPAGAMIKLALGVIGEFDAV